MNRMDNSAGITTILRLERRARASRLHKRNIQEIADSVANIWHQYWTVLISRLRRHARDLGRQSISNNNCIISDHVANRYSKT